MTDARTIILDDVHEVLTDLVRTYADDPHKQARLNAAILALDGIASIIPEIKSQNYLNGMRIIARTKEAIYLRIPEALQVPSSFADGHCTCGHCDGSGKWDTLAIPLLITPQRPKSYSDDHAWMVHMPDKAVQPFIDAMQRKGLA